MTDFYQLDEAGQAEAMGVLARAALPEWGFEGSELDLIKYRENGVFKLTTPSGERYALRIHRYAYHNDAELRSELQWMSALAQNGVFVPTLVPTSAGEPFAVVTTPIVPEPRQIDVFEWVEFEGHAASTKKAAPAREDDCIECLACEDDCPVVAIKIYPM